jgi:DHA1 family multidrug resistance protein-like MFS transporter
MASESEDLSSERRLVRTLVSVVFLQWLGATAIIPMLPVYVRDRVGSDGLAGVIMAAFFAAGVITAYPLGKLADRIGRRKVLLGGLGLFAVASFGFLLGWPVWCGVGLRALQGVGESGAVVAALALISGSVGVGRRGRAFGAVFAAEIAGMAVGPLIGSVLGVAHMNLVFAMAGGGVALAMIPAWRLSEGHGGVVRMVREQLSIPGSMRGALVAGAALGLTTGVYDICWTLLLLSRGAASWQIGLSWTLFALPFLVMARPSGWLADRVDRRWLVLGGLGMAALFCAGYPHVHNVGLLIAMGAVESIGFAAAMPSLQSLLTQGGDPGVVGRVQGLFSTVQMGCTALAAALAGAAFAVADWLPFSVVAVASAVALIVSGVIWRRVEGRVSAHALAGEISPGG